MAGLAFRLDTAYTVMGVTTKVSTTPMQRYDMVRATFLISHMLMSRRRCSLSISGTLSSCNHIHHKRIRFVLHECVESMGPYLELLDL